MTKFNNTEDLLKLKESINKSFDKKIKEIELTEKVTSLNDENFGTIKSLFEHITQDLFNDKNGKMIMKAFLNEVRSNKSLKEAYSLYGQLKKLPNTINENSLLTLFEGVSKNIDSKEFKVGKTKLITTLKKGLMESNITTKEIDEVLNENKAFNESFDYLLENKRCSKNMVDTYNSINKIGEYIKENVDLNGKQDTPEIKNAKEVCEDVNELLKGDMEEWEKKVIIDNIMSTVSGKNNKDVFEEYKQKCIEAIDDACEDCEIEDKASFSSMKAQVEKKTYNEETYNDDIFKLAELINTIKNED
jgi:hypothetical protein